MGLIYRFTYSHDTDGSYQFTEAEGWKDAKLGFERHDKFHSLTEFFKSGAFSLYGRSGSHNGGRDWVKDIETTYGPDAEIGILIEGSDDGGHVFQEIFTGIMAIASLNEILDIDHTIQIGYTNSGFWRKFISRLETPVDLKSTTDLDGNAVSALSEIDILLTNQFIRYSYDGVSNDTFTVRPADYGLSPTSDQYVIVPSNDTAEKDDIEVSSAFEVHAAEEDASILFVAPWDGAYRIQRQFTATRWDGSVWTYPDNVAAGGGDALHFYLKIKGLDTNIQLTKTNSASSDAYIYDIDVVLNLKRGDTVKLFSLVTKTGGTVTFFNCSILGETLWEYKAVCNAMAFSDTALTGTYTLDGVALTNGMLVLATGQNDPTQNGVWVVSAGAWSRYSALNAASEFELAAVYVSGGSFYGNTSWKQTAEVNTLGVDEIVFESTPNSDERNGLYSGSAGRDNFLIITADTTYRKTNADGFLLHDAASGIINRITGQSLPFYSEYFGSGLTDRVYDEDGCEWKNALLRGLQIRGYSLADKPFAMSFREWFDGVDPVFNIGLAYERINGQDCIRCEPKEHFYDSTSMSVLFSNVTKIKRSHDEDFYFNLVEIGHDKWESEEVSGLDDPQTKRSYASVFKNIGKKITLYSKFIAASLTFEITRRTSIEKSKDYKYDNDTFLLALQEYEGLYRPELNENFDQINNVINASTRYNVKLTPARALLRWLNLLSGGLQSYPSSEFRFVSGEGNFDMTSEMVASGCRGDYNGDLLSEKGNIQVSTDYLFIPELFEIEHYMTLSQYNAIKASPKKAIGISQTDSGHVAFFIKSLEYSPEEGMCKILAWPKTRFVIDPTLINQETESLGFKIFGPEFDFTFE